MTALIGVTTTIGKTDIPTATHGWNPVKGCTIGCSYCWARGISKRFWREWAKAELKWHEGGSKTYRANWYDGYKIISEDKRKLERFEPVMMDFQRHKKFPNKPSIIATGWMSDVSCWNELWIESILNDIELDNKERITEREVPHRFQFLSKRPQFFAQYVWPENCDLGTTITCQKDADERIPELLKAGSGGVKFLYCEPLIEAVTLDLTGIDWVVAGGMDGPAKCLPEWVRSLHAQCVVAGVPFFFKGWGRPVPAGQKKGLLDGVQYREWPEVYCE